MWTGTVRDCPVGPVNVSVCSFNNNLKVKDCLTYIDAPFYQFHVRKTSPTFKCMIESPFGYDFISASLGICLHSLYYYCNYLCFLRTLFN